MQFTFILFWTGVNSPRTVLEKAAPGQYDWRTSGLWWEIHQTTYAAWYNSRIATNKKRSLPEVKKLPLDSCNWVEFTRTADQTVLTIFGENARAQSDTIFKRCLALIWVCLCGGKKKPSHLVDCQGRH